MLEERWIAQSASASDALRTALLPVIASSRRGVVATSLASGSAAFRSIPDWRGA
jgi:hypothetical protein